VAVTLVTKADVRLTADIEKLIKRKIELSPIELDNERPQRFSRPRRDWDDGDAPQREAAPARNNYRAPAASRDPFFDKPYEATASAEPAAWERSTAAPAAKGGLSSYIKPKKKVAALFGAKRVESNLEG